MLCVTLCIPYFFPVIIYCFYSWLDMLSVKTPSLTAEVNLWKFLIIMCEHLTKSARRLQLFDCLALVIVCDQTSCCSWEVKCCQFSRSRLKLQSMMLPIKEHVSHCPGSEVNRARCLGMAINLSSAHHQNLEFFFHSFIFNVLFHQSATTTL